MSAGKNGTNEASIMDSTKIDGTPFSVLMSQAIKMKTAQDAPSRSIYDKYPTFYKNSLYPRDEVILARGKNFEQRMTHAAHFKHEGNQAMKDDQYIDAITKYEMALSVFKYLENTNPTWKNQVSVGFSSSLYALYPVMTQLDPFRILLFEGNTRRRYKRSHIQK
jgi:hypothetical protein